MTRILLRIAFRLLLCCAASYAMWLRFGASGLAMSAPVFGVALARPIIDLVAEFTAQAKRMALADLEGRNFAFRGLRLDIAEHSDGYRWISMRDVRKVLPALPRDEVLRSRFPADVEEDRIRAEALLAYLAKSTETDSIKFRNWLEKDVVFPAAKGRGASRSATVR